MMNGQGLKLLFAAIAVSQLVFTNWSHALIPEHQKSIQFDHVIKANPVDTMFSPKKWGEYLPPLSPTNNPEALQEQFSLGFTQKVTDRLLQSRTFKRSPLGKATDAVQQAAKQSVEFSTSPKGVTHKVDVDIKAIERIAHIRYSGYFNSNFTYVAEENILHTVISKPLGKNTVLSLRNVSPAGQIEQNGQLTLTHNF